MASPHRKIQRQVSRLSSNALIELSISCSNLKNADLFSLSDPMVVLFVEEGCEWKELGRTEIIKNCLNPEFARKFTLNCRFEETQLFRFDVYDIDSQSRNLKNQDFLGRLECTSGELIKYPSITRSLEGREITVGTITVTITELTALGDVTLKFEGSHLDKKTKHFFSSSSSPFLVLSRENEDGSYTVVHRTEHVNNDVNPKWKSFTLPGAILCNGDYDRKLKLDCYDYQKDGNHKFIGESFTCLRRLNHGKSSVNVYGLKNADREIQSSNYKNSGEIILVYAEVATFMGYVSGGVELVCTVAIDFTSSNGDPHWPNSLHYLSADGPNQYVQALTAVGEIIQYYDSDRRFPLLGFGARIPPDKNLPDYFFVNMNPNDPFCNGINGMVDAYRESLQKIELYGPTNFAPVIKYAASYASTTKDGSKYHILLIITDGIITDMEETKEVIVEASNLPLSIIIVGVGDSDYSSMEELDADVARLSYNGKEAERDIVQFVPFKEFQKNLKNQESPKEVQVRLAKSVLAEIPSQFLSFMQMNKIKPKPPKILRSFPLPPDPEAL